MTATYTPQPDSVAARVIAWFQANPDKALDTDALEAKFQKPRKQWHSLLGSAVIAGVLKRQENTETDELEYSLGSGKVTIKPAAPAADKRPDMLLAGASAGWQPKPQQKRTPRAMFLFDPLSLTIVSDRPLPLGSGRGRTGVDWKPLFQKLKPGQSVDVPAAARPTPTKQMTDSKKSGGAEFVLRKINDEIYGLWRVK